MLSLITSCRISNVSSFASIIQQMFVISCCSAKISTHYRRRIRTTKNSMLAQLLRQQLKYFAEVSPGYIDGKDSTKLFAKNSNFICRCLASASRLMQEKKKKLDFFTKYFSRLLRTMRSKSTHPTSQTLNSSPPNKDSMTSASLATV